MKKLLLASVALVSLAACNNDDNSNDSASIVGTWKQSKYVVYNGKNNSVLIADSPDQCEKNNTITFSNDGKYTSTSYYSSNGTCKVDATFTDTYTYDPNTKILTTADGKGEVRKLTATDLHFVAEKYDENGDGVDDIFVVELTRVK